MTELGQPVARPKLTVTHDGRTKLQVRVTGASAPFWLVLGQSQNAGWRAHVDGVGSLGGSQLVDGFANGWRIDPKGRQSLVVDLEWVPQQRVWLAIILSVIGALLCCGIAAVGFRRARREVRALEPRFAIAADTDATPQFTWPWLPAGEPVGVRTQVVTTLGGAALAAGFAGLWAGVLVGVALALAFREPRARAILALAPPVLVGLVGMYVAYHQLTEVLPPVFEWPILFTRATKPAWAAIVLFGADALYELVRRGRRSGGVPEPHGHGAVESDYRHRLHDQGHDPPVA